MIQFMTSQVIGLYVTWSGSIAGLFCGLASFTIFDLLCKVKSLCEVERSPGKSVMELEIQKWQSWSKDICIVRCVRTSTNHHHCLISSNISL